VIGWALGRTLEYELTMAALRMALERRIPQPGLVHHSDRGVQYASKDYTDLLKGRKINISMSRKGNPYDKDYASYCTSWVPCATTSFTRRRSDSFLPCAFRGGLLPGCSNR
jgi:putative transposase